MSKANVVKFEPANLRIKRLSSRWIEGSSVCKALYHMNPSGAITSVNVAFARLFGYKSPFEAVCGLRNGIRELFVSQKHHMDFIRTLQKEKDFIKFDAELIRLDGSTFWGEFFIDLSLRKDTKHFFHGHVYNLFPLETEENIIRITMNSIVKMAQNLVQFRDSYTSLHQKRVAVLCRLMAEDLGLPNYMSDALYLSSLIHDIGKIAVPMEFLAKPGKLSHIERQVINGHVQAGYDMIKGVPFPWPIAEILYQHHERLDGSGYPRGLKSDEIVMEARIIAVADTIEAIIYDRPYRPGRSVECAKEIICSLSGNQLDRQVVEASCRVMADLSHLLPDRLAIIT